MIHKDILPAAIEFKGRLAKSIDDQQDAKIDPRVDKELLNQINDHVNNLHDKAKKLNAPLDGLGHEIEDAEKIASELLPLSEEIAIEIAYLEENVSEELWPLPTYYDLLFVR